MNKKVAILIPTIKPYGISCKLVVDSIINSINKKPIAKYDIFLSGPINPDDKRIIFIPEKNQLGENITINNLAKEVLLKYDYIFLTADDYIVDDKSVLFDAIDFLESSIFDNRMMKICTLATTQDSPCYSYKHLPFPEGSPYGKIYNPNNSFSIPHLMICRFPFVKTETINKYLNNKIYPSSVSSGYGDSCLSYFLYSNGEPCIECSNVKLSFLEHIHNLDRISRKTSEWIENRSKSCINAYNFISKYTAGKIYE